MRLAAFHHSAFVLEIARYLVSKRFSPLMYVAFIVDIMTSPSVYSIDAGCHLPANWLWVIKAGGKPRTACWRSDLLPSAAAARLQAAFLDGVNGAANAVAAHVACWRFWQ